MSSGSADPALRDDPRLAPLLACPMFAPMPENALRGLADIAHKRHYAVGEAVFRVGDTPEAAFVICTGRVSAVIRSPAGRGLVLHVAGPGEAPGQLDIIDQAPRSAHAVAHEDAELLVMPARVVRATLLEHPAALMSFAGDLAGIVRRLSEIASDLVFLDLPGRLAKLLLSRPAPDHRVELGVTQSELAAQLGVTRQSLNRALGELQRRGLIRVEASGTSIELLDHMALRRLAVDSGEPLSPR